MTARTNSAELLKVLNETGRVNWPITWRLWEQARRLVLKFRPHDDYDWSKYSQGYRAQFDWTNQFYSVNLGDVDFKLVDGRLFLLGDCKPLHPTHRCVWEAICNLPGINSVAEIGTGAGYFLVSLRALLGQTASLSGYDISESQLHLFQQLWPAEALEIKTAILDLVRNPIPTPDRPDVAFASTVLMHIQRVAEYQAALRNVLSSARQFVVLMDNWRSHDYFRDLADLTCAGGEFGGCLTYLYDSGANMAIVISLKGATLSAPYQPLTHPGSLEKYLLVA